MKREDYSIIIITPNLVRVKYKLHNNLSGDISADEKEKWKKKKNTSRYVAKIQHT